MYLNFGDKSNFQRHAILGLYLEINHFITLHLIGGLWSTSTRSGSLSSHGSLLLQAFNVSLVCITSLFGLFDSGILVDLLPSKSSVCNQSLDFWGLKSLLPFTSFVGLLITYPM